MVAAAGPPTPTRIQSLHCPIPALGIGSEEEEGGGGRGKLGGMGRSGIL